MTDRTLWLKDKKWGIFVHYLHSLQNGKETVQNPRGETTSWNDSVNDFDTELIARQINKIGVGYVIFTLCQQSRFMCAPNAAFDRLTGYKPGEACAQRDLIEDLADSLKKYDIPLMLYYTGDGPQKDEKAAKALDTISDTKLDVDYNFVSKWAEIMRDYAVKYGKKVSGWWIDGCFDYIGYTDELLKLYRDAAHCGNEDAIIAFNNSVVRMDFADEELAKIAAPAKRYMDKLVLVDKAAREGNEIARKAFEISDTPMKYRYSTYEDYTAGESSFFGEIPSDRFTDGSQWHALSFLGLSTSMPLWGIECGWCCPGSRYSGEWMRDYIHGVNENGGVVSVDVFVDRYGNMDKGQLEVLAKIR